METLHAMIKKIKECRRNSNIVRKIKGDEKMSYIEEISKRLYNYKPKLTKEEDFDMFWEKTIQQTKAVPLNATKERIDYPIDGVEVYKITYNGFDNTVIHGWYILPKSNQKKYPCLIHYHGFGWYAGEPWEYMHWIMAGFAVIAVDCREQLGYTGSSMHTTTGNAQSVVCKGLLDKNEYYFRAVYMDALKVIDFAEQEEGINASRIILEGGSQGGAIVMAVAALDDRTYIALADVPSNSNLQKRVENEHGSFSAVTAYLKCYPEHTEQVFKTLSYFDTMNMAHQIKCKTLASVGLKDNVCPAELYFATYNRIEGEKSISIYPFNGHEGGGNKHVNVKLSYLRDNL